MLLSSVKSKFGYVAFFSGKKLGFYVLLSSVKNKFCMLLSSVERKVTYVAIFSTNQIGLYVAIFSRNESVLCCYLQEKAI